MVDHKSIKERYEEAKGILKTEFGLKSVLSVPRLMKVVINMGTGDYQKDKSVQDKLVADLSVITGQRPKIQRARISVAGFGVRAGNPVGLTVTLRGERMYVFLDRLISVVLPRLRDFRGLSRESFDGCGNYSLGLSEYSVFPEIDIVKLDRPRGLEITIVTSAKNKKMAERLLELVGMPFEKGKHG